MALFGGSSQKSQVQWVEYYYSLRGVLCLGGVDNITRIKANDKDLFYNTTYDLTASNDITATVGQYDLYGSRDKEGGFVAPIRIKDGHPTQTADNYFGINGKLNNSTSDLLEEPAYLYVTTLSLENAYIGNSSNFGNLEIWAARTQRELDYSDMWYKEKAKVFGGINPVHIIRETLTYYGSPVKGRPVNFNDTNFRAVADRLYDEGLGLSYYITEPTVVQDFIDEICKQADIYLNFNEYTQQYNLVLMRETDPTGAFEISDTNGYLVEFISATQSEAGDAVTQVDIEYTNDDRHDEKDIESAFDTGMFEELGRHNISKITYAGVTKPSIARSLADRELRKLNACPETIEIKATIHADVLNAGNLVIFSFSQRGYSNRGFRVVSKQKTGFLRAKYVTLKLISDLWVDVATIDQTVDPIPVPEQPTEVPSRVDNILYYQMATILGDAEARAKDGSEVAFIHQTINDNNNQYYRLRIDTDTQVDTYDLGAGFLINQDISKIDTVITYSDVYNNSKISTDKYAMLNDEVIYIEAIDYVNKTIIIQRGLLDTYPQEHGTGAYLFATQGNYRANDKYFLNDDLDIKFLTLKNGFELDYTTTTNYDITLDPRYYKPYPPKNIQINGQDPLTTSITVSAEDIKITFSSRNRLTETGALFLNYYDGATTIEYNALNQVVLEFFLSGVSQGTITTQVNTNSITVTQAEVQADIGTDDYDVTATISAIRDGVESYQTFSTDFVFEQIVAPTISAIAPLTTTSTGNIKAIIFDLGSSDIVNLEYQFRYRLQGNTTWIESAWQTGDTYSISGLTEDAAYEYQVSLRDNVLLSSSVSEIRTLLTNSINVGLISHYTMNHFNENIVIDEVGNYNATIYGATETIYGLSFDGIDNYLDFGSSFDISGNELSVAFRAELFTPATVTSLIYFTNDESVGNKPVINAHIPWSDNNIYYDCGYDTTFATNRISKAISTSEWTGVHDWVLQKNAVTGVMEIYIDGVLWHSETGKTAAIINTIYNKLCYYAPQNTYKKAIFSYLRFYSKTLTLTEITALNS
ncbi:hypothetical protein LO80_03125 [Candidatus Francisella endociliophora]|uniref:Uncharacterized protein n=1 Tax=Candidatus Francisella endociliophora TaxID=653937 RepID=A0A097ENC5_9GAMM|nr:phage tail protein [Francisella sp. FSC1006]AIT09065.1 hypothetical protein LO80_03125 [Francisella sp. FSC1006]